MPVLTVKETASALPWIGPGGTVNAILVNTVLFRHAGQALLPAARLRQTPMPAQQGRQECPLHNPPGTVSNREADGPGEKSEGGKRVAPASGCGAGAPADADRAGSRQLDAQGRRGLRSGL